MSFYIYEHWRPDKGFPFYVGKGTGRRAWLIHKRNRHHGNIVKKLVSMGMAVEVRILASDLNESEAFDMEKKTIRKWKSEGIELVNMTDGGEGSSNPSPEIRQKLREARLGKPFPKHEYTEERLERMRAASLGKTHNDETKKKISASQTGKKRGPLTADHRLKISLAMKGKLSSETREKIGAAQRGKAVSAETRKKLSESAKLRWSRKKASIAEICQQTAL